MRVLNITGITGHSKILVGEKLQNLGNYIPVQKPIIITDINVSRIYEKNFPSCNIIKIESGEEIKTLDTIKEIYRQLVEFEVDRSSFLIGIGGGIVCDIAGFVASTYMRGIRFGFVSTTLLSQVDASVGGKNGVNFLGYKNMIGNFNQPEFVVCDMGLLKTLPEREILCGFGEIAKHAFIGDIRMCEYIEQNHEKAIRLDSQIITKLVYDSIVIKSNIVNRDEKERGERKKLNFGHTFGHALEKTTKDILHGEAISIGMVVASKLSQKKGLLSAEDFKRIKNLLIKLKLPVRWDTDKRKLVEAIKKDKKRDGEYIDFVLLNGIGNAVIEKISIRELEDVILDL